MPPVRRNSKTAALEARVSAVGRDLAGTIGRVLDAIPGAPHRPGSLASRLGLNAVLTSRLLKATSQRDPLVVAHVVPGPEPLRRLLRAAERQKVSRELIKDAAAAVDRFQQLIDAEAGDRTGFDAIISGWLPDAREKVELVAKQAVFRGTSQLIGTACDVGHYSVILYPSARCDDRADQVWINALQGLRRVRPGSTLNYDTIHAGSQLLTLDGQPVDSLHGLLLEQFCSSPLPQLEVVHYDDVTQYTVAGQEVGARSAVDLVHATYLPERKQVRLQPGEAPRRAALAVGIDPPMKTFLFDALLHRDIFAGRQPSVDIYRTAGVASTRPSDRREIDRLDLLASVQELGEGLSRFRTATTPQYQEMIGLVCEKRRWDPDLLRGFRCRIEYPMYSSEIVFRFDVP